MDMISGLPDELVIQIARFLSAKEAACVLVLSKRFRNLYTVVADFVFHDSFGFQGTFTDFVSGALAILGNTTYLRKFSLKSIKGLDSARINTWLRDVLQRGVMDLELCIYGDNGYSLPSEIFTCKTIVKLKLVGGFVISAVTPNALLPALETLILGDVRFYALDDCAFEAFLSACPVLKELSINCSNWETWKWSRIVSSQSLQRLFICRIYYHTEPESLSFNTPSLAYFSYISDYPEAYPIVNFDSLVEAKLILTDSYDHTSNNPTNLFRGIRNVKILGLDCPGTVEVLYFFRDALPVFEKLERLTLAHDNVGGYCWRCLPVLLDKSPNLKTLRIGGGLHYLQGPGPDYVCGCVSGYSYLMSCRVEVLEITLWDGGTIGELEQVKHFLGKLQCLKFLKVYTSRRIGDWDRLRIVNGIQNLPNASSKCKLMFNWDLPTYMHEEQMIRT